MLIRIHLLYDSDRVPRMISGGCSVRIKTLTGRLFRVGCAIDGTRRPEPAPEEDRLNDRPTTGFVGVLSANVFSRGPLTNRRV